MFLIMIQLASHVYFVLAKAGGKKIEHSISEKYTVSTHPETESLTESKGHKSN